MKFKYKRSQLGTEFDRRLRCFKYFLPIYRSQHWDFKTKFCTHVPFPPYRPSSCKKCLLWQFSSSVRDRN